MSNAVAKIQPKHAYPAFAMEEKELIEVLRNSLYPGASDGSIKMVVSYCKASNLDPMQKPVHIVPIWDSKASTMRDVVMPGIGLYRSQASRSGEYAGVSEPEFGDDVTETFLEEVEYDKYQKSNKTREAVTVTYPKWCRVTVKRLLPNGAIVEFAAKELWKENYATASRNSKHPNAMWSRRPYAQLAKCAEAQALRKAFPEFGAQPTADEMEGKEIDVTGETQVIREQKPEPKPLDDVAFKALEAKFKGHIESGKKSADDMIAWVESRNTVMNEAQKAEVRSWAKKPEVIEGEQVNDPFVDDMNNAEGEAQ